MTRVQIRVAISVFLVMLAVTLSPKLVQSQTSSWTGGGVDDDWSTPANWDSGVPISSTNAVITPTDIFGGDIGVESSTPTTSIFGSGTGLLDVSGFSLLNLTGNLNVASDSSVNQTGGTVQVMGNAVFDASSLTSSIGGQFNAGQVLVQNGAGLEISSSGSMTANSFTANEANGIVNVSGSLMVNGLMKVEGNSNVSINGGSLFLQELTIGDGDIGSSSNMTISGATDVSGKTTIKVDGNLHVSSGSVNLADLDLIGSNINVNTFSQIMGSGTLNVSEGGMVIVDADSAFSFGTIGFGQDGGTFTMDGEVDGDLMQDGGTFSAGQSPGIATIDGNYTLDAGTLLMELGGTSTTQYDHLNVTGNMTIDGTGTNLDIVWYTGFSASAGDSFDLFDFGVTTGWFENVMLPTLGSGLVWDTSTLQVDGILSLSAVPEPTSLLIFGVSLFGLSYWRRRTAN